jgi:hypothetical protein
MRGKPIVFESSALIESVVSDLSFTIAAHQDSYFEFYGERDDGNGAVF